MSVKQKYASEKQIEDFLESIKVMGLKIVDEDNNEVSDSFVIEQYFGTF